MEPSLVLIHSPFLGPVTWQSTARVLERSGRRVHVPSLLGVAAGAPPYWPAGVDAIARSAGAEPVILVLHSNAGLFAPAAVDALGDRARGLVFVDAALPGAGHHTTPEFLNRLPISDGLLPPWTSWWDEAEVAEAFPDPDVRDQLEAEQPRMPLAYYDHLPPAPDDWDPPPCGLLWFGAPYDKGAAEANERGWPTEHLPGNHLHMLADPDAVAAAVLRIADNWG